MITITVSVVCLGCVEFGGMIGYQPRSGGRAETGDELITELFQTSCPEYFVLLFP